MADLKTLTVLIANVREASDQENSLFVTDAEIIKRINEAIKDFYDLVTDTVQDYNLTSSNITISSGNTMNLPSTFYKMRGLDDMSDSANPREVRRYVFAERNRFSRPRPLPIDTEFSEVWYTLGASTISIIPPDIAARAYRLWYVPTATELVSGGDTVDVINGFDKYITAVAAIQIMIKEESDPGALMTIASGERQRIIAMAPRRDQSGPGKVARIRSRSYGDSYRLGYPGNEI